MQLRWNKNTAGKLSAKAGPLLAEIEPKGDGRFDWRVYREGTPNPMASGIANSLGAAKNVAQQFAMRTGLV